MENEVSMKAIHRLLVSSLMLLLTACKQPEAGNGGAAGGGPPPAQVSVMAMQPRDVPVGFEYVGQIAGSNEVEVRTRVTGIVDKRTFQEGSAVKAGQTLFQLDPAMFKVQLEQAEAALAGAKAGRENAWAQLKKAERDYARVAPLAQRQLLSQSQRDDASSVLELARAGLQQAEAAILQAQAGVRNARISLDYTTIKAPIAGIAGRALMREGSLAQAGSGSDSLLTTIAQTDPAYVEFGMAESEHSQLRQALAAGKLRLPEAGFAVALKTTAGTPLTQTGRMNFQDYKVDPQTGNFALRASIANPDKQLAPGQFVRVLLQGAQRPQAFVLPQRAVLDNPQGKYVYVLAKNEQGTAIAQPRPVEVGEWVQLGGELGNAWVIKSGLKAGDQVITEGMARIFFPGMPVQTGAPAPAPAQPSATGKG
jgi:membrane fusion protein (multidrug efflux system)